MRCLGRSILLAATIALAANVVVQSAELTLPSSADEVEKAGGRMLGNFPAMGADQNLLLGAGLALAYPTERFFDPTKGSIEMEVSPTWPGDDGKAHAFCHLGGGQCHVTVFKTDGASLRFVYKASADLYAACDINVRAWKPGDRHHIVASWLGTGNGQLLLQLEVDGNHTLTSGATVLPELPAELFLGRRGPKIQPAQARFLSFRLSNDPGEWPYATGPKPPVTARVDFSSVHPLRRVHDFTTIWNNRTNPLPFQVGDPEYQRFLDAQFHMVRLVAFSESWLWGTEVTVDDEGKLKTDFTDFDRLLDTFTTAGAEPYIRLAYHTPDALVAKNVPKDKRRYALPADLEMWDELMERIVTHVRHERKLPVRYWVTSLNEGDLPVLKGEAKPETVYRLYERTSRLVKKLDSEAKVGGPALAYSVDADGKPSEMLVEFIRYCRDRQVPLDFVCFHGYRKAHPRDYERLLNTIRSTVEKEWPEKAGKLEYFLDEWNLWNRDRRQDNEFGASYLAGALQYQRRSGLTKSSIVSFNHFLPTRGEERVLAEKVGPFHRSKGSPVCFEVGPWTCGNQSRPGFRLHPPNGHAAYSYARFTVQIPSEGAPHLEVGTGVAGNFERWTGCGFSVLLRQGDKTTCLLDKFQRTRHWLQHRLPLAEFAGQSVEIEFRTTAGANGEANGDWAVWGEPRMSWKNPQGRDQSLELLKQASQATAGAKQDAWRFVYSERSIAEFTGLPLIKGPVITAPYFVWLMHARLAGQEALVYLPGKDGILQDDSGGLTATFDSKRIALLAWHFDLLRSEPRQWTIRLDHLPPILQDTARFRVTEYRIDHQHNNPYTEYVLQGADTRDGAYNLKTARLVPLRSESVDAVDGQVTVEFALPNQSVSLIELVPVP